MKNIVIIYKIILMLIILILLFSINSEVFALSDIISSGDSFIGRADSSKAVIDPTEIQTEIQSLSGYLYNILLAAGVVIAVIVATALGIQLMLGGVEGQAKVKEMMLPFIVGCVIVFGGFGIWKIAISLGVNLDSGTTGNSGSLQPDKETSDEKTYESGVKEAMQYAASHSMNLNVVYTAYTNAKSKSESAVSTSRDYWKGYADALESYLQSKNYEGISGSLQTDKETSDEKTYESGVKEAMQYATSYSNNLDVVYTAYAKAKLKSESAVSTSRDYWKGYADALESYLQSKNYEGI